MVLWFLFYWLGLQLGHALAINQFINLWLWLAVLWDSSLQESRKFPRPFFLARTIVCCPGDGTKEQEAEARAAGCQDFTWERLGLH